VCAGQRTPRCGIEPALVEDERTRRPPTPASAHSVRVRVREDLEIARQTSELLASPAA
jgi:hypothetical protein